MEEFWTPNNSPTPGTNCRSAWVRFSSVILTLVTDKTVSARYMFFMLIILLSRMFICTQWWYIENVLLCPSSLALWCYWSPLPQTSESQISLKTHTQHTQRQKKTVSAANNGIFERVSCCTLRLTCQPVQIGWSRIIMSQNRNALCYQQGYDKYTTTALQQI